MAKEQGRRGKKSVAQIKREDVGRLKRQCLFLVHHTCQSHSGQGNDKCQSRKLQRLENKTWAGRILCFFSDSHTFPWNYYSFFRVSCVVTKKIKSVVRNMNQTPFCGCELALLLKQHSSYYFPHFLLSSFTLFSLKLPKSFLLLKGYEAAGDAVWLVGKKV